MQCTLQCCAYGHCCNNTACPVRLFTWLLDEIHILSGLQDYKTLYATMKRIADAEPRDLDTWNIGITAGDRRLLATQLPLTVLYGWTKHA